jgi:DNA gyrase subunit B
MNEESALSEYEREVQAIRRRPGMYFGSTSTKGVEHFVYELVANVLDAFLVKQATFVNNTPDSFKLSQSTRKLSIH